ncbi:MAG: SIMPL domain-containing protein [Pseudomonadota bacterium]
MATERTVTVNGTGEVEAAPDRARVSMGVEARNLNQVSAQQAVETVVRDFLSMVRKLDIDAEHVRSTQLVVRPEYDWDSKTRERVFRGYYVSRQLEVDVRELAKLGDLMEGATRVGITQVSPPQLESSRKDVLRRQALEKAAEDARLNAHALAETLSAKAGNVRRITTVATGFQPPPGPRPMLESRAMAADKSGGGGDTYETGLIRFSAQVTAEFDLLVE